MEKSDISLAPVPRSGLTMKRWAVAGPAWAMGVSSLPRSSVSSACASGSGSPTSSAPEASAPNSREREMASWITSATSGATTAQASSSSPLGPSRSLRPPPRMAPQRST